MTLNDLLERIADNIQGASPIDLDHAQALDLADIALSVVISADMLRDPDPELSVAEIAAYAAIR